MKTNQIKVGLFLAIGTVILIVSIFLMGSNRSIFNKTLNIYSYFDSAQGLNKGGIVTFAGVKAGNIDSMEYDETKNLVKVTYLIQSEFANKIKSDSVVELKTQGALGDKYLYITPGSQGAALTDNSELKSDYGNDILTVLSKRGTESEKLFDAIADLQKITKSIADQNKIPSILSKTDQLVSKLDQVAGSLNDTAAELKKATANGRLDKTVAKVEKIVEKIDNGQGTLGALINDRSLHDRLKSLLGAGQKEQQIKSILKSSVE